MDRRGDEVEKTLKAFNQEALLPLCTSPPRPGQMRGVDFYGRHFARVYRNALRNFLQFHERLPDAEALPLAADHLFFSKFFRAFPTEPNAASKLNAALFLDRARFGDRIYIPRRKFISQEPTLPPDLDEVRGWWLKLDLGNADHLVLSAQTRRRDLERRLRRWFRGPPYGLLWGEWWYAASPQRVFFEEDLRDRMPGDEYQFFMKGGRCLMFKKKRIHPPTPGKPPRITAAYYDQAGRHVPGLQPDYGPADTLEISPHVDLMMEAATQIAGAFDHIRVDFILLHEGPALGELSYCTMNARIFYSTPALERLAREAVRMDLPGR